MKKGKKTTDQKQPANMAETPTERQTFEKPDPDLPGENFDKFIPGLGYCNRDTFRAIMGD